MAVRKSQAVSSVLEFSALRSRKLEAGAYSLGPVKKYFDLGSISYQLAGFEEANSQRLRLEESLVVCLG